MKWSANVVAGFTLDAGFTGDDAVTAVAIVLAVSKGDDLFRFTAAAPGCGDWRGLWAINVDLYPSARVYDLTRPAEAAAAARALTVEHDGFSWSPVWRTRSHIPYVMTARAAVAAPDRTPTAATTPDPSYARGRGEWVAGQVRTLGSHVSSLRALKGH